MGPRHKQEEVKGDKGRKAYKRIIHSKRWSEMSRAYKAVHPLCEECLKRGIVDSPATEVHHVRPIGSGRTVAEMEALAFDANNLEALCHDCHAMMHKRLRRYRMADGTKKEPSADAAVRSFLSGFGI